MYFWNIKGLKAVLAERSLSDRETLPYFVLLVALFSASTVGDSNRNHWDELLDAGYVLLAIFGTINLFWKNGGSAGRDFVARYLAVGWVFTIRFAAVVVVPAFMFAGIILEFPEVMNGIEVLVYLAVDVFWHLGLGGHLQDLARISRE